MFNRLKSLCHAMCYPGYVAMRLARVQCLGPSVAKHLKVLLVAKPKAQYQMRSPSPTETKRCIRAMRNLIKIAQEVLCQD